MIEICTAQGIKTVLLDVSLNEDAPNLPDLQETCQFCFAQSHLAQYFASNQIEFVSIIFTTNAVFEQYQTAITQKLYSPQQSRAPPSIV